MRLAFLGPPGPTICCSSPERFLRGDRGGLLEARPIKGTAARRPADPAADAAAAAALAASEKERAENLMIVDLLRNDLGRVCEVRGHAAGASVLRTSRMSFWAQVALLLTTSLSYNLCGDWHPCAEWRY